MDLRKNQGIKDVMKKGILLLNLGTPDDTRVSSVRRYLREFLTDPRVIDLPVLARYLLVFCAILPFRPFKTAKAYRKIWTDDSPLRTITKEMTRLLGQKLGDDYQVDYAMRYGAPAISTVVAKFQHCDDLTILPLFPQYSSAATGSAIEKTLIEVSKKWNIPRINVIHQFYNHPLFIAACVAHVQEHLKTHNRTHNASDETVLIFSYHGLPERHIQKSGCMIMCQGDTPCPKISIENKCCYRAQCYETTRLIAEKLALAPNTFMTSFQSRLGKTPWIKPYTDQALIELREKNIKNLIVFSPSFTADCLETLEELGIELKKDWLELGGTSLSVLPCLNTNPLWIDALSMLVAPGDRMAE